MPVMSPANPGAVNYGPQTRARMDALVLNIIRSADASAAAGLRELSLGLADTEQRAPERYFWSVCATFFEALATGLSTLDVADKRLAAQTLRVYMQLARGETPLWDELLPPCWPLAPSEIPPPARRRPPPRHWPQSPCGCCRVATLLMPRTGFG